MTNYRIPTNAGEKTIPPRDSAVLVLTTKRTIQQNTFKYSNLRKQVERVEKGLPLETPRKKPLRPYKKLSEPPRFCGSIKNLFIEIDENGIASIVKKGIPCNQYNCPICGPKKIKRLRKLLIDVVKLNTLDRFVTLTLDPSKIPSEYLYPINRTGIYISKLWNHFVLTLKRKMKKPIQFAWIKQFQENGNAHLHILVNQFLPRNMLVYHWNRIGGGHILDIQK